MTVVTWWVPGAMALVGLVLLVLGLIGWRRGGTAAPGRARPARSGHARRRLRSESTNRCESRPAQGRTHGRPRPFASRATPSSMPSGTPSVASRTGPRCVATSGAGGKRSPGPTTAGASRKSPPGLAELGIEPGQQVGIFTNNRVEWHLADFGILANGSVTVPLYQTSSAEQVAYILGHAEARACFVENHELAGKVLKVRDQLPELDQIVVFDDDERLDDPFVVGFEQLRALGAARLRIGTRRLRPAGLTRSRPSSSRPSSTRAARPDAPKGR